MVDEFGRRMGKKVDGALVQGLLYQDQLNPGVELDSLGQVVSRFVYATRSHVPSYMVKGGTTYRIVSDHLGSVRLVIDESTGTVAQRLDYDEFGRVLTDTNPGFQPFGFAGGIYDADTGLTRFGARDYDPEAGRWAAKDPILFNGGNPNLLTYTANDPVNAVDVDGRCPQCVAAILALWGAAEVGLTISDFVDFLGTLFDPCASSGDKLTSFGLAAAGVIGPGGGYGKGVSLWGNRGTLARHFRDHGADFGARSSSEYADLASEFLVDSQRRGLPTKIGPDGTIRVYDPGTNTFGAFNPDGTTKTFFKPTGGAGYFGRQPGTSIP